MKRLLSIFMCLALILAVVVCSYSTSNAKKDENIHLVYSAVTVSLAPFTQYLARLFEKMCTENGWQYTILDGGANPAIQSQQIESILLMEDVDGVLLFPVDDATAVNWVRQLDGAGIPVVMFISDVLEAGRKHVVGYAGSDYKTTSKRLVEYLVDKFGAQAGLNCVVINGVPSQQDYILTWNGVQDALKKTNYKVLVNEYAYASRADAQTIMENALIAYKDIDAVIGLDTHLCLGAVAAIRESGRQEEITVVAKGLTKEGCAAVRNGDIEFLEGSRIDGMMQQVAKCFKEVFDGKKPKYYWYTEIYELRKDNVDEYVPEY